MERCFVRAAQPGLSQKAYGPVGNPMGEGTSLPLCARNYIAQTAKYPGPQRPSDYPSSPHPPGTHLKPARLQIVITHLLFVCLEEDSDGETVLD